MDNNLVHKIEKLISELPKTDVPFGNKYLKNRDFESLQLLINSAIVRVKKSLAKEKPKEEYLKVDLNKLSELKVVVDTYYSIMEVPENKNIYEDYISGEFNEDYY
jgi:hypothetical protein